MSQLRAAYQLLNLESGASFAEAKRQYRNLVKDTHPDRILHVQRRLAAESRLKELNCQFEVIVRHFIKEHKEVGACVCRWAPSKVSGSPEKAVNSAVRPAAAGKGSTSETRVAQPFETTRADLSSVRAEMENYAYEAARIRIIQEAARELWRRKVFPNKHNG